MNSHCLEGLSWGPMVGSLWALNLWPPPLGEKRGTAEDPGFIISEERLLSLPHSARSWKNQCNFWECSVGASYRLHMGHVLGMWRRMWTWPCPFMSSVIPHGHISAKQLLFPPSPMEKMLAARDPEGKKHFPPIQVSSFLSPHCLCQPGTQPTFSLPSLLRLWGQWAGRTGVERSYVDEL